MEEENLACILRLQTAEENMEHEKRKRRYLEETKGELEIEQKKKEKRVEKEIIDSKLHDEKFKKQSMLSVLRAEGGKEEEIDVEKIYNKLVDKMIGVLTSLNPSRHEEYKKKDGIELL